MQKKSDVILICVSVILVIVLIGGVIYDRDSALLERTNYIVINGDDNLELVKMNTTSFLGSSKDLRSAFWLSTPR